LEAVLTQVSIFNEAQTQQMRHALALAAKGLFTTTPNPRVGCVIERDGVRVGEGWHLRAGEPHAEINALNQAGERARGATAYVTLEPCSHHGRTPPCADALITAGVSTVVVATEDPNPKVAGRGIERLKDAGISVLVGLCADEAQELNIGFMHRMRFGRPWVRAKAAASLDAITALPDGRSQWITGEAARADGHRWRARACAILTGFGTVRDDDPQLNVRHVDTERQPIRVVVDARLETPLSAKVLRLPDGKIDTSTLIVYATDSNNRTASLQDAGVQMHQLANGAGKVDLAALIRELGERQINEIHVEAGFKLNGSLQREHCVDEWLLYLAPCFLGQGNGIANLSAVGSLAERHAFAFHSVERLGEDLRIMIRRNPTTNVGD